MNKNTTSKNKNELNGRNCHTHAESSYGKSKNKSSQSAYDSYTKNSTDSEQNCGKDEYGKNCGR